MVFARVVREVVLGPGCRSPTSRTITYFPDHHLLRGPGEYPDTRELPSIPQKSPTTPPRSGGIRRRPAGTPKETAETGGDTQRNGGDRRGHPKKRRTAAKPRPSETSSTDAPLPRWGTGGAPKPLNDGVRRNFLQDPPRNTGLQCPHGSDNGRS